MILPAAPVSAVPVVVLLRTKVVADGAAKTVAPEAVNVERLLMLTVIPATSPCATVVV
jgi:hypothetical protein